MNIYSPFKALHHSDNITLLREKKLPIPTQVQIDLTNVCNHDCIYCVYRYEEAEDVDFDTKQETNKWC